MTLLTRLRKEKNGKNNKSWPREMEKKPSCWILDAGPLLEQFPVESLVHSAAINLSSSPTHQPSSFVCTTSNIVKEVKSDYARALLESRIRNGLIKILDPNPKTLQSIKKQLQKNGSWWILSPADREILALAIELKKTHQPILITNDFEIQNACSLLHITWQEFNRIGNRKPKIKDQIKWIFQCTQCKRKYRAFTPNCPNCGGKLKRKVKKIRKIPE